MEVGVDLIEYGMIAVWVPKLGDFIFKDGGMFRWCGLIDGIKDDNLSIKKSGNPQLLLTGDYKNGIVNRRKIASARFGSYFVVSKGVIFI